MKDYIKEISNSINFTDNSLIKINNFYLTKKEMSILDKYKIDYQNCTDFQMLMYLIDECLDDYEAYDLEEISIDISDRNYYLNTNK